MSFSCLFDRSDVVYVNGSWKVQTFSLILVKFKFARVNIITEGNTQHVFVSIGENLNAVEGAI